MVSALAAVVGGGVEDPRNDVVGQNGRQLAGGETWMSGRCSGEGREVD